MNVFSDALVRPNAVSLVGGLLTTTKIFASPLGPGFMNGGANFGYQTAPVTVPAYASGTPAAFLTIPGNGVYEQQQVELRASGFVFVHGASPTVNFLLQSGTSLTYNASGQTTVATLASAQSLTTADYYPWYFGVKMQADALSGIMQFQNATFACNGTSGTVTLTDLTGINLTTTNVNFVIGITFGVSDALNVAGLAQFQLGT